MSPNFSFVSTVLCFVLLMCLWFIPVDANVKCTFGLVPAACPDDAPVCCYQSSGRVIGCCPESFVCDVDSGGCVVGTPSPSNNNNNNKNNNDDETAYALQPIHSTVVVTPLMLGLSVAFLLSLCACCYCAYHGRRAIERFHIRRRERQAQQRREAREARTLLPNGQSADAAQQELEERAVSSDEEDVILTHHAENEAAVDVSTVTCRVCKGERIDCVLLPCGHFVVCFVCALHLKHCPTCQKDIQRRKKVFHA